MNQDEYIPSLSQEAGVRVLLTSERSIPFPFDEGFTVSPGFATSIGLRKVCLIKNILVTGFSNNIKKSKARNHVLFKQGGLLKTWTKVDKKDDPTSFPGLFPWTWKSPWNEVEDDLIQQDTHIKRTGVLVVPLRMFSVKRPTAGSFAAPFRVLNWKNHAHKTGSRGFFQNLRRAPGSFLYESSPSDCDSFTRAIDEMSEMFLLTIYSQLDFNPKTNNGL